MIDLFTEICLSVLMHEYAGPGQWKVNPGDGAFYGPKIDIKGTLRGYLIP